MPGAVFMRGERVTLNTIHPEDYPFVEKQLNDPSIRQQAGVSVPWSETEVADFIEETEDTVQFLVCRNGTPIGHVALTELDTQASNAELGWIVITPEEQGNGFATEAVELCLTHAFNDRGLHKVWARVNEDNRASIRVLEKHGFEQEGVLREQEYVDGEYVDVRRYGLIAP
ncbi:GNAT family N-acetyltransferase [Halostella sp. JP-L12]|uniref:GNAT family N-acetyltransferase n=1 Tax=Halostella TaxID=1843185 RepID=UPI000EF77452|nr:MULTISPECIES: GNAT family protein [Halostella]NHN46505.1 GNAT family N-acetyltransferase [Halostella sp. JP-L12]